MKWQIEYTETAKKSLLSIDKQVAKRIKKYLDERIAANDDPRRFGKGLSSNLAGLWRYRIGDYRVIVEIQDDRIVVLVLAIGHRNKIYNSPYKRCFMDARSCRSQMERTPEGETKMPFLRSSLLALTCP